MADAAFKDLVLDATDGARLAAFWSAALGLRARPAGEDAVNFVLEDDDPTHTLWINVVPEPRTVRQRVHLDVRATVAELEALGAKVDTAGPHAVGMRDPEGGELCAVPDAAIESGAYRPHALVVDSADAGKASAWWGRRFGLEPRPLDGREGYAIGPGGSLPFPMHFVPVPEPKSVKNRIHWDVLGDTDALLAAGATMVMSHEDSDDPHVFWDVLADPEGNEFCVFAPED